MLGVVGPWWCKGAWARLVGGGVVGGCNYSLLIKYNLKEKLAILFFL